MLVPLIFAKIRINGLERLLGIPSNESWCLMNFGCVILFIHFSSEKGAIAVVFIRGSYQVANSIFSTLVWLFVRSTCAFAIATVRQFSVRNCLHVSSHHEYMQAKCVCCECRSKCAFLCSMSWNEKFNESIRKQAPLLYV